MKWEREPGLECEGNGSALGRRGGKTVICPAGEFGGIYSNRSWVGLFICRACGMFQALEETDLGSSSGCRSY